MKVKVPFNRNSYILYTKSSSGQVYTHNGISIKNIQSLKPRVSYALNRRRRGVSCNTESDEMKRKQWGNEWFRLMFYESIFLLSHNHPLTLALSNAA